MTKDTQIRDLITRLAKLESMHAWTAGLNPTQHAMLGYLAQANRFSRSPSHVAEYLGTTRGTATQSLKSLHQKGYVFEKRSDVDKRVIRYELSETGREMARLETPLQTALSSLSDTDKNRLGPTLHGVLGTVLAANKGREFGLCKTCKHHQSRDNAPYCALLDVMLSPDETDQICHEQVSA